jgi:hypothetical protein
LTDVVCGSYNLRDDGMWDDLEKDGKAKNASSFNRTGLYT